jgi:hypothetical protein
MKDEIRRRLVWVRMYENTRDAGLVCRRCGISRPTLEVASLFWTDFSGGVSG